MADKSIQRNLPDDEKTQAVLRLLDELEKGKRTGEENGWLTLEAMEETLGLFHE